MSPTLRVFFSKNREVLSIKNLEWDRSCHRAIRYSGFCRGLFSRSCWRFLGFWGGEICFFRICPLAGFHCELLGFPIFPPWKDTEKNTIAISQGRFVSGNFGQHHRHHH